MNVSPESRLEELGLTLPPCPPNTSNYLGTVTVGDLVFVAGHGPFKDGELIHKGRVGESMDVDTAVEAAQLVALNMLSTLKAEFGELSRIKRVVKLLIMINSAPDFDRHQMIANGASDLMVDVFGETGKHARSTVGMAALPLGLAVEAEGVFQITS